MKMIVVEPHDRPYENPIAVSAGERLTPDFYKPTDIDGWVWCTAKDGRSGWVPKQWLTQLKEIWYIDRDFNAIELTVVPGDRLEVEFEESGFYWVRKANGEAGWIPCRHVAITTQT